MIKDWPVYFKDRLIISNLDSSVGVATLWMPKESVASHLDPESYAVCGQLYTKRGLNPLFRNILLYGIKSYLFLFSGKTLEIRILFTISFWNSIGY